jgi:hypothetical protein
LPPTEAYQNPLTGSNFQITNSQSLDLLLHKVEAVWFQPIKHHLPKADAIFPLETPFPDALPIDKRSEPTADILKDQKAISPLEHCMKPGNGPLRKPQIHLGSATDPQR